MIRYTLACDQGHSFESWFASSAAYDKQAKRKLVACPMCGSTKVEKTIMAPALARKDKQAIVPSETRPPAAAEPTSPVAIVSEQELAVRAKLKELREQIVRNSDYVGEKFPEEARKMHYGEIDHRSIYGEASPDDAKALHEEGIEFHPIPRLPDDRN